MEGENPTTDLRTRTDLVYRLDAPNRRSRNLYGADNFTSRIVRSRRFSLGANFISNSQRRKRRYSSTFELSQLHL